MKLIVIPANTGLPSNYHVVQYINRKQVIDDIITQYERHSRDIPIMVFADNMIPCDLNVLEIKRITSEVVNTVTARNSIKTRTHYIRSSSGQLTYAIRYRDEEGWTCTCPDFTFRGNNHCKHIRRVGSNPEEFMND